MTDSPLRNLPADATIRDVLLVGSGDLGTAVGLQFVKQGSRVTAIRRHAGVLPASFHGISADIADGLPALVPMAGVGGGPHVLVVTLTAGAREAEAYRRVFIVSVGRVLRDISRRGWAPERAIFVSSTAVCAASGFIDETTPDGPESETAQVLAAAEKQFFELLPDATDGVVVRPSGLYGPGREFFLNQVRTGSVRNPERITHRIHRDDVAAAIVHLATMPTRPQPLYLVTDDEPVLARDVADFLAAELAERGEQAAWSTRSPDGSELAGAGAGKQSPRASHQASQRERQLSNARLRGTGFSLRYPTFREGYRAVLDGSHERYS